MSDGERSDAIPEAARQAAHEAIVAVVQDHLAFNVAAYGKAWTGEDEDTEFIVDDAAAKALAAAAPLLLGGGEAEPRPQGDEVETAARALMPTGIGSWDEQPEHHRSHLLRQAETVLAALDARSGADRPEGDRRWCPNCGGSATEPRGGCPDPGHRPEQPSPDSLGGQPPDRESE